MKTARYNHHYQRPVSKALESFRARKAIAKSRTLRLHSCFTHKFLKYEQRFPSIIQEDSGVYTSPFLDTEELKMASWDRNVSKALEKRALDLLKLFKLKV